MAGPPGGGALLGAPDIVINDTHHRRRADLATNAASWHTPVAVDARPSVRGGHPDGVPVRTAANVRITLAAGLAGLATLVAGCSGGSASTTSSSGATIAAAASSSTTAGALDGLTADQLAQQAIHQLTTASSVHINGVVVDGKDKISIDETTVAGKGCQGTFTQPGQGAFQLKIIGSGSWLNPDRAFWKSHGLTDPAAVTLLSGKWIKMSPKSDLAALTQLCGLSTLLGKSLTESGNLGLEKGAPTTVNGQAALTLTDPADHSSLLVSAGAAPQLLQLVSTSDGSKLTFSGYGAKVALTPPPAAKSIDGKKFGI